MEQTSPLFRPSISFLKRPISSHLDSGSPRLRCKVSKPNFGFGQMNYIYGAGKINEDLIVTKSAGTDQGQPAFLFSTVSEIQLFEFMVY
jgi:hypothetical protein